MAWWSPWFSPTTHDGELRFWFVLAGGVVVSPSQGDAIALGVDDAISIPAGWAYALVDVTDDLELLEVTLPA